MLEESRKRFVPYLYFPCYYLLLNQKVNKFPGLLIHVENYKRFIRSREMFAVWEGIHLYCHGEQTNIQYCCLGNGNILVLLHFKILVLFALYGTTVQPKIDWLCNIMTFLFSFWLLWYYLEKKEWYKSRRYWKQELWITVHSSEKEGLMGTLHLERLLFVLHISKSNHIYITLTISTAHTSKAMWPATECSVQRIPNSDWCLWL